MISFYKNNCPNHRCAVVLQYSSIVEKDLNTSVHLTKEFLKAFQRWLLSRPKLNNNSFQDFAKTISTRVDLQGIPTPTTLYTVTRSPFVYKKTREQFGLRKCKRFVYLPLNHTQQELFLQLITQLKLPAELTVHLR